MNYWLAVGSVNNWKTAFKKGNTWGLKITQRHLWDGIKENDKLIFYATKPVGGIIGHGTITTKFRQNKPLWPEEVRNNEVIWPLRFEFYVDSCLPPSEWETKKVISKSIFARAGFQQLSETKGEDLVSEIGVEEYSNKNKADESSQIKEESLDYVAIPSARRSVPSLHDEIKHKLIEIGKLQDYIAEQEYSFDLGKLDVVWRRVLNSVPTYVFEVQVGGDIYHALSKLKHAYDLWNSNIFIVASEDDRNKADSLLSGTFHEIGQCIKFIELDKVIELHQRKKDYFSLEKSLGIKT